MAQEAETAAAPVPTAWPADHPTVRFGRVGVLLLNLGTPDATDYWSIRRYLKQFLSDRRVIDLNRLFWWPLLNGVILTTRPSRTGAAYRSIWNYDLDESPLKTITRGQADNLAARLRDRYGDDVRVAWGMRYGNPSTQSALDGLIAQGCRRVVVFPLYPQYSATTTATACDEVFRVLGGLRWQPAIRVVPPYHDEATYISALASSVRRRLAELDWEPEILVTSFHGLPQRYFDAGDPYHCHCAKTSRLLREALGWPRERVRLSFQSRFGNEPWLQPYTDEAVAALARDEGVRRMAIVAPGFSSDCVETLEELNEEVRDAFESNGGSHFCLVPCLNDDAEHTSMMETLVEREASGWLTPRGRVAAAAS